MTSIESHSTAPVAEAETLERQRNQRYQQAITLLALGKNSAAEEALTKYLQDYPDSAGAYLNLAYVLFGRQQLKDSMQAVNKSIEMNASIAQAYNHRATLQLKHGDIQRALEDYQQAIDLNPDYANAHYNLALLYDIYLQDILPAIRHYQIYLGLLEDDDERTREWVDYLKNAIPHGK